MPGNNEKAAENLTGRQKAAVVIVSMGPDASAKILRQLSESEIEKLTYDIANLPKISAKARSEILQEFQNMYLANEYISEGGLQYAKELLEKAMGRDRAADILTRLTSTMQPKPFDFARKADPAQLLNFIQNEHSQTISLILSFLQPDQSATILSALPAKRQVEVAERLATMESTSPDVIKDVESVLQEKVSSFMSEEHKQAGGIDAAVDILNRVDRTTEKTILESLEESDPELAEEIKNRMFIFEDIVVLDDRSIQRLLREVDNKDLAMALKTSSDEVSSLVFKNMSQRAREMLQEDMEYLGPVRLREVEDAQQRIVNIIRRLDEAGEILIARGGEDEVVV